MLTVTDTDIHTDYQVLTEADTDYTDTDIRNIWAD